MSKFILKVIGITTIVIIIAFAFVVMGIAVMAPSAMAKTYDSMGFRYRAKLYAEKAYEKESSVQSLVLLVNISIKCEDNEFVEKYSSELLGKTAFNEYIETINNGEAYYDFVASNYIKSCYILSKKSNYEIVNLAMSYSMQYRNANATETLILNAYENKDKDILNYILSTLNDFKNSGNCPLNSQERLAKDVENLTTLIGKL